MTYVIVLPSVYEPYVEPCLGSLDPAVRDHVMVVDNTVTNRGVARSWNVGARRVLDEGLDWMVSLSAATRFGPSGGRDFVAQLDQHDVWVIESGPPVGWHCIAWSRSLFERIGIFDENFWPAYGEDADWSYRTLLAAAGVRPWPWQVFDTDAWITMQGHTTRLAGIAATPEWDYYRRKWNGLSGHETFTRPFDDPALGLDFWPARNPV